MSSTTALRTRKVFVKYERLRTCKVFVSNCGNVIKLIDKTPALNKMVMLKI